MRFRATFAALLFVAATAASAEPIFPKGGSVGLEPPPGMVPADDFMGFRSGASSILITELPPAAYAQIDAKRDQFAAQVGSAKVEDVTIGGAKGFIVRGKQNAGGKEFRKWAVVLGAPSATALITAQVAPEDKEVTDATVEAALRSIALRERPDLATQVASLPFTVGDLAGFRASQTASGAILLLTEGPKDEDPEMTQPSIVVSSGLNVPPPPEQRGEFVRSVLLAMKPLRQVEPEPMQVIEADGAQWAQVRAKAVRGKGDVPVEVTLFMRFDQDGFLTVICTAPRSKPGYAERFKQLALSVKPKG